MGIQYEAKWATFLKTLYDRSKNVFVICTGSAALLLREQLNTDLARRVIFEEIYPVNFTEYLLLKYKKHPVKGVGKRLREGILQSQDVEYFFAEVEKHKEQVNNYWLKIDRFELEKYLKTGTLPFTLQSKNEALSLEYIGQTINNIIFKDLPQFASFETESLNRVEQILYLLADSSNISITNLSNTLEMRQETISALLNSLEKAGLLVKVPALGRPYRQVRQQSKYLFASPSFRYYFLMSRDSRRALDEYRGNLFEDLVMMYLNRIVPQIGNTSITYDTSKKGADFVVKTAHKEVVIEVGLGEKDIKQAENTIARTNADYGVVISQSELELVDSKIIKLPLKYFLLI